MTKEMLNKKKRKKNYIFNNIILLINLVLCSSLDMHYFCYLFKGFKKIMNFLSTSLIKHFKVKVNKVTLMKSFDLRGNIKNALPLGKDIKTGLKSRGKQ